MKTMFRFTLALPVLWLCLQMLSTETVRAKPLLADLDFSEGDWTMVGVSLYNARMIPMQQTVGTFVMSDLRVLQQMKNEWRFGGMYEDHCEYHYALKFYRGKELMKTLKVNLVCEYVTEGVFSYEFPPEMLKKHRLNFRSVAWSKVRFKSLERLREVVPKLNAAPDAWLYHDPEPYMHDGYFVVKTGNMPWDVDRDSVLQAMRAQVVAETGMKDFHIVPFIFFLNEQWQISFRFFVYCDEQLARRFPQAIVTGPWRSHFAFRDPDDKVVELIVAGITPERYKEILATY